MADLTPFEWMFALALSLERGEMHVLDGFRTEQRFLHEKKLVVLVWSLLGEEIIMRCSWPFEPRGPVEVVGKLREMVIARALSILNRRIAEAIAAKEAENA